MIAIRTHHFDIMTRLGFFYKLVIVGKCKIEIMYEFFFLLRAETTAFDIGIDDELTTDAYLQWVSIRSNHFGMKQISRCKGSLLRGFAK